MAVARARVLVLGWHDATPRHLRVVARLHQLRGDVVHTVLSGAGGALARRGGYRSEGERQARAFARAHEASPRPWLAHSFSNAGFWTLAAMLEALGREHPFVLDAHVGTILDSAPGFPRDFGVAFTARTAPMAFLPGLLARLGRPPSHEHPILRPLLAALFAAWHVSAPSTIRQMRDALEVVRDAHRVGAARAARPILALDGGADRLVEARYVEAFLADCEAAGVPVERHFFEKSPHVRHLVTHRVAYEAAVRAFRDRTAL